MPLEWDGDAGIATVSPPEAYLLLRGLDLVKAEADNQRTVRLALFVETAEGDTLDFGPERYRTSEEPVVLPDGNTHFAGGFWIGRVISYAELRPALQRIVNSAVSGLEQRRLTNLAFTMLPQLDRVRDEVEGIATWVIGGR